MISGDEQGAKSTMKEKQVSSILDSISQEFIDDFQPVHKRYYEERYCTRFTTENNNLDTLIRFHSNRVAVIYLSPKHSLFQNASRIKNIDFQVSSDINRLDNKPSGKGKKKAQILTPESILCVVSTDDEKQYPIHAGFQGKLLELNTAVIENPNILLEDTISTGFLAVILSDKRKHKENLENLKSYVEYFT